MDGSSTGEGAAILPFVRRGTMRFGPGVRERIAALRWADAARPFGVRAVQFHEPEPGDDPGVGCFLLIYVDDALWAAWGVSMGVESYEVWRPASGATVGAFPTLVEALAMIQAVA